ncbi:family 2A encapsulin nanocompartment cargo protein cysteine desulfurase [Pinibacter aurantiacus]|uniref:Cysteine desulfurase n=1 Tax=Pinibacter aurantiacus TaxID=2851599 RepID=A0A9E2SD83_9BACT|nr:family 2A encapsulin nanocompartment cargo protein cysteine desulfurase [Pinibacter aurantiacus]MBV4360566.1 cysteine desulfurase [Pinibacter aurantiacus]
MSTNIEHNELPDIAFLEQLANQYFKESPVPQQPEISAAQGLPYAGQESNYDTLVAQSSAAPVAPLVGTVPLQQPSVAGSGVSPSAIGYVNLIDLGNTAPEPPLQSGNINEGGVPLSVAGSGASPSTVQHGNNVNFDDPQTSFPDTNLKGSNSRNIPGDSVFSPATVLKKYGVGFDEHVPSTGSHFGQPSVAEPPKSSYSSSEGGVPLSVAGSGASPSTVQHGNNVNFDDPQTGFPDANLKGRDQRNIPGDSAFSPANVLKEYGVAFDVEHIPFLDLHSGQTAIDHYPATGIEQTPSYYFLPDNHQAQPLINEPVLAKSNYSTSSLLPWGFDANIIKKDFPILSERVNGKPVIWLDNAATTQKPRSVIDRISYFYEHENSNIHRAAHTLAARATDAYEEARKKVQLFIGAGSPNEIIFVRGTTEAINLVAKSWGEQNLSAGDEIILTHLEHHANIVPWQQLAAKKGLKIRVVPVDDDGQVLLDEYAKLLNPKTKLVSFTQVSNALGTVTPAKQIIQMAKQAGAKVLLDGAQSVSHLRVNVRELDVDWFVFSGHKIFGPTGIGVVFGKEDLLNETQPWQGGGNMIKDVTFERTQFQNAPYRFEAGTGNIADAVGLGAALDYVTHLGIDNIYQYEHYLLQYATHLMQQVPGLKLIGTAPDKTSVLSFTLNGYTNDQVGQALNQEGIAVRTGHHCAQPILRRFGLESTVRPSLAFYNTCNDVDVMVATLRRLKGMK